MVYIGVIIAVGFLAFYGVVIRDTCIFNKVDPA